MPEDTNRPNVTDALRLLRRPMVRWHRAFVTEWPGQPTADEIWHRLAVSYLLSIMTGSEQAAYYAGVRSRLEAIPARPMKGDDDASHGGGDR